MEINVVIPSELDKDQDLIEDIIELQKVIREEGKSAPIIHIPEDIARAIVLNGIIGGVAGKALRESIQKAAKARAEFKIRSLALTFTEAVRSLHDFSIPDPEDIKPVCYKPSQFPVKKRKKDIYKKL